MIRFDANCTFLFKELDLLERPAAARKAGFDAIELWWPFDVADPTDDDMAPLVTAIRTAGVDVVGLNLFAGDLAGPDCGIVSWPGREAEFRIAVERAMSLGERIGTRVFNALYGNVIHGVTREEQAAVAHENLAFATKAAAAIGATVLLEPISGPKPYPLRTSADVLGVLDELNASGLTHLAMLFDLYHLAGNGDDVTAAITAVGDRIGHVQLADVPGRGEPGSGTLPLQDYLVALESSGYAGWVGLEYNPSQGDTASSLDWLPVEHRGAAGADLQQWRIA